MNELANFMSGLGHEVTIITSKPGRTQISRANGIETEYHRQLWQPWMARFGLLDFHVFPFTTLRRVLLRGFDLIHVFNFTDALAACAARSVTGVPVLLHLNTIPSAVRYRRSLTTGGALLRSAIRKADEILVIGHQQQEYFVKRFGRQVVRLPAPVDTDAFRLSKERDQQRPILLCVSALDDRRKGGRLLMKAFNQVKKVRPEVRMEIRYELPAAVQAELLELVEPRWRADIDFSGSGPMDDLPAAYGRAAALVLPSMWEAFPLAVLEALATGTPVAGTRDGGIPELLSDERVGRTFEPGPSGTAEPSNLEGLSNAIIEVLQLSRDSETPGRCRKAAERFSWQTLGHRYQELYLKLARAGKGDE